MRSWLKTLPQTIAASWEGVSGWSGREWWWWCVRSMLLLGLLYQYLLFVMSISSNHKAYLHVVPMIKL